MFFPTRNIFTISWTLCSWNLVLVCNLTNMKCSSLQDPVTVDASQVFVEKYIADLSFSSWAIFRTQYMIGSGNNKNCEEWFFDHTDTTYLNFLILPCIYLFSVGSIWLSCTAMFTGMSVSRNSYFSQKERSCKLQSIHTLKDMLAWWVFH